MVPTRSRAECGRARADEELERHLEDMRRQVEDPKTNIARREVLVLEIAALLDRTGQSAPTVDARRSRWTEAIALLDRFETQNPGHPRARETQFQAAVYLWALARSWQQQAELDPTNQTARNEAIKDLDAAFVRLRAIQETIQPGDGELLAQNLRFRIAQTLADRAELDPEGSPGRQRFEQDALAALERPITEPALRGFAQLLRAELLCRQGRFDEAEEALATAAKIKPAPPPADLLGARVAILSGRKRFDEAISTIDAAALDAAASKNALAVRLLLSQLRPARHRVPSGRRPSRLCFAGSPSCGQLHRPRRARYCSSWRGEWSSPTPTRDPKPGRP